MDWEELKSNLANDCEYTDPLYDLTEAGEYLQGVCVDVEREMDIYLEPSIQAGVGGIWIYSGFENVDECIAEGIDYESFNEDVIDIALSCDSEDEFKERYSSYLDSAISSHTCEYDDDEDSDEF